MEAYETDLMSRTQIKSFEKWIEKNIGTDWEINQIETDEFYMVIFDLTFKEVEMIRNYENSLEVSNV